MATNKKESSNGVMTVVVLAVVCCLLIGGANFVLGPMVEEALASQASGAMSLVMPEGKGFTEVDLPADAPATVQHIYAENQGLGYVVELATTSQYSQGDMGILVGIGKDGIITGTSLTSYNETRDFGAEYPQSYVGQDSSLGDIVMAAGATYSSTAFKDAILDAYTALFTFGDVAEGQKSDSQLIAELMTTILPGACDGLGNPLVTDMENPGGNIVSVSKANNGTGYVVAVKAGDKTVAVGINAMGCYHAIDVEGNDVTDNKDYAAAIEEAIAAIPGPDAAALDASKASAELAFESTPSLTEINDLKCFGSIVGAFQDSSTGNYAFVTKPFGFDNQTMSMVVVINGSGEIVTLRTAELILNGEYYTQHELKDESAYRAKFKGLTEGSYSKDVAMVAGATLTSNAVHKSIEDAFAAFKYVNGGN